MTTGDDTSREQQQPPPPRHAQSDEDQAALFDHYERQSADDGQQPLLARRRTPESAQSGAPAGADVNAATRASAAGARILHAIPHFSQWLQDVNSHAATQLQMHGLRHQGSSGGGASSTTDDDAVGRAPATEVDTGAASQNLVDVDLFSDRDDEDDGIDRRRDGEPPRSRRRGAPVARSVASLPPSRFEEIAARSDGHIVHRTEESSDGEAHSEFSSGDPGVSTSAATSTTLPHQENANSDDQSAIDELQALFRRCHHSLPFVGLFIVYFAYQHTTGIVVFAVGTVAIVGLDQRIRTQVALKEKTSALHLAGIVAMCVIDTFALCCIDGDPNPLRHFLRTFQSDKVLHDGTLWDVLWTVIVNGKPVSPLISLCTG